MAGISMNELTTYRWSFEEDVERYRAAGFEAMSVWRPKLGEYGEPRGADLMRERGMRAASLLWAGGFTGCDGRPLPDAIEDGLEAIRTAKLLDAGCLTIYAGARGGHTRNHARRLLRMALRELAPAASAAGVTLAIEPMHAVGGGELTFLHSVDEALEVLDEFPGPHVRLAFDAYHFGQDAAVLARIPQWASRIAIVQLGDGRHEPCAEQNRCRLGDGCVPLAAIVQTLAGAGYDGDYDVELMGEDLAAIPYDELLAHSRRFVARLLADPSRAAG